MSNMSDQTGGLDTTRTMENNDPPAEELTEKEKEDWTKEGKSELDKKYFGIFSRARHGRFHVCPPQLSPRPGSICHPRPFIAFLLDMRERFRRCCTRGVHCTSTVSLSQMLTWCCPAGMRANPQIRRGCRCQRRVWQHATHRRLPEREKEARKTLPPVQGKHQGGQLAGQHGAALLLHIWIRRPWRLPHI